MARSDNESDDASVHDKATNAQQQPNNQPRIITTVSNNNVIQNGNSLKRTGRDRDRRVIILPPTTADEHIAVQRESKERTTLLQSIPDDHVTDFHYMDDARDIWNAVKARFGGNAESKKIRKSMLKQEFLEFGIGKAEGLHKGGRSPISCDVDLRSNAPGHIILLRPDLEVLQIAKASATPQDINALIASSVTRVVVVVVAGVVLVLGAFLGGIFFKITK
nr:xylulose kinase-1 [Tanacetum cinerariifolium]